MGAVKPRTGVRHTYTIGKHRASALSEGTLPIFFIGSKCLQLQGFLSSWLKQKAALVAQVERHQLCDREGPGSIPAAQGRRHCGVAWVLTPALLKTAGVDPSNFWAPKYKYK